MKKILLFMMVASVAFTACEKNGGKDFDRAEIKMKGLVGDAEGRGVIDADYALDLPVNFARIDQDEADGYYPRYGYKTSATYDVTRAGGAGVTSLTFDIPQYYSDHWKYFATKMVGWYPRKGHVDGVVSLAVDGSSDIMLTQEIEADRTSQFGSTGRIFRFQHLLTQLQFKAYASNAVTAEYWGNIRDIKIKSQAPMCDITLPDGVAFSGNAADLPIVHKDITDATNVSYPIAQGITEGNAVYCGYAMIQPAFKNGITIEVDTEKQGLQTVTLTSPGDEFSAGHSYVVMLNFSVMHINPSSSIVGWVQVVDPVEVEF